MIECKLNIYWNVIKLTFLGKKLGVLLYVVNVHPVIKFQIRWLYDVMWYDIWYYVIWCDMIYDIMWYDVMWYMIWYMIWYNMIWYGMIWYDMICYDVMWYDIWYDIFVNCDWVDSRLQQYSTHLHTNSTQNNTMKQITENGTYVTIRIHEHNNKNI